MVKCLKTYIAIQAIEINKTVAEGIVSYITCTILLIYDLL